MAIDYSKYKKATTTTSLPSAKVDYSKYKKAEVKLPQKKDDLAFELGDVKGLSITNPVAQAKLGTKIFKRGGKALVRNIKGLGKLYGGGEEGIASQLKENVVEGSKDIQRGMEKGGIAGTGSVLKGVTKAGLRSAGDFATTMFAPVGAVVGAATEAVGIPGAFAKAGEVITEKSGIADIPAVQKFAVNHPNAEKDFTRALTLLSIGVDKARGGNQDIDVKTMLPRTKDQAVAATQYIDDAIQHGKQKVKTYLEDKYVKSEKNLWSKPSQTTKASYKDASEIYKRASEQGDDISDTLVKNKINIEDNIEATDTGKNVFSTKSSAQRLRDDAVQASKDLLRPALKEADNFTTRLDVNQYVDNAIRRLKSDKLIPVEVQNKMVAQMEKTRQALLSKFDDGMGLVDLHDEKIVRDYNSHYNKFGDTQSKQAAVINKKFADSARNFVEKRAPKEIGVNEFNKVLSSQYRAADYLDALNTKPVPRSFVQNTLRTGSKIAGAGVGQAVAGGGIVQGVGGYHIGAILFDMVDSMPSPLRARFLNNLQVSNPEAFTQIRNFLISQGDEAALRIGLPAPSPLGTERNPIVTPAPTTFEPKAQQGASTSINPKTGDIYSRDINTGQVSYFPRGTESIQGNQSPLTNRSVANPMSNISKNSNIPPMVGQSATPVNTTIKGYVDMARMLTKDPSSGNITQILDMARNNIVTVLDKAGQTELANQVARIQVGSLNSVDEFASSLIKAGLK